MYLSNGQVTSTLEDLFHTIFSGLDVRGFLFDIFSSWQSAAATILDVLVTSAVIYYVMKLFNDSRAWQLLKGFLFILTFTFFCNAMGLTTINYVLSNSISILVIGFVVVFQPEMRKTLETVGRSSFNLLSTVSQELTETGVKWETNMIEAIAVACENMSATCTGALIVIERSTGLNELVDNSPTVVILNANLTSTTLEQIFYKNSPLHDGALLVRDGRIYAARCHVPLADTYHLRKDLGTRHRAALGSSEIGDTIAVVVSEETGNISIAREGRLYTLESADALRSILHRIFNAGEMEIRDEKSANPLANIVQNIRVIARSKKSNSSAIEKEMRPEELAIRRKLKWRQRGLKALSVAIALILYIYVQTITNPIETESFRQLAIAKEGVQVLDEQGYKMFSTQQTANVVIRARRNTLNKVRSNPDWVLSVLNVPTENLQEGQFAWPVEVKILNISSSSYEVTSIDPLLVTVTLTKEKSEENVILPGIDQNANGGIIQLP